MRKQVMVPVENIDASEMADGDADADDNLQQRDIASAHGKLKTVGLRNGIQLGKEEQLQEGFNAGIRHSAKQSYSIAKVRGAFKTVMVTDMLKGKENIDYDALQHCLDNLDAAPTRLPALTPAVILQLENVFELVSLHEMTDLVRNLYVSNGEKKQA